MAKDTAKDDSESRYYDILVVGRSGLGKTTLVKKIESIAVKEKLETNNTNSRALPEETFSNQQSASVRLDSTKTFELLCNDQIAVRVLDVPGFQPSAAGCDHSGSENRSVDHNMFEIFHGITEKKMQENLQICRVVYFLPSRGALEVADGRLKEELRALYTFFGLSVFKCMVIAATQNPKLSKKAAFVQFDEEDMQSTRDTLHEALKDVISEEIVIDCPPVIFIDQSIDGATALEEIKQAKVLSREEHALEFNSFESESCARCSLKTVCYTNNHELRFVSCENDKYLPLEKTMCHPAFKENHSKRGKIIGGICHIITLGIFWIICFCLKRDISGVWPCFTTKTSLICVVCKKAPGTPGCTFVGKPYLQRSVYGSTAEDVCPDHNKYLR